MRRSRDSRFRSVLIVTPDRPLAETAASECSRWGYAALLAGNLDEARKLLADRSDLAFSWLDLGLGERSVLSFLEKHPMRSLLVSAKGQPAPSQIEAFHTLGAIEILPRDVPERRLREALSCLDKCLNDPLYEIIETAERISGVQLVKEKRELVETRLIRRVRALNLPSLDSYLEYFLSHRKTEVPELISLVTTHTTEFFREPEHFDYLFDRVFPRILGAPNKKAVIWSAASSSGQEVYSLAISVLEYARDHPELAVLGSVEILGTDIDFASVNTAREGIYPKELVSPLSPELVERYFDIGTGEIAGFVKVKEIVHRLCRFSRINLASDPFPFENVDVVFLRNVLIYFKPKDVESIANRIEKTLAPQGLLFLGHSESLDGLSTSLAPVGNSIYAADNRETPPAAARPLPPGDGPQVAVLSAPRPSAPAAHEAAPRASRSPSRPDLILIGTSTGGVEALKTILQMFPKGSPPIVIVQHIPAIFSNTLAKRLNEYCAIDVSEGMDNEKILPSHAYIAPGGKQMRILRRQSGLFLEVNDEPPLGLHKPSIDYLFRSVVPFTLGLKVSAAILTGMGSDGAQGLKELRDAGAHTIAQNEETCVVFGMPGVAISLGGAVQVLPLGEIPEHLLKAA
jgi:chemotaxis response regulator CheB/chemotaxis methyl-accepting protein methylase